MSRKPYVREVPPTRWYFKHPRYMRYMSREITCFFVGALALLMVCTLERLTHGKAAFDAFIAALQGPWSFLGLALILLFCTYNAFNWFNVTPKAMPIQKGEEFVEGKVIVGAHYAVWVVATLAIFFLAGVV